MKRLISLTLRPGTIGLMVIFSLILAACSSPAAATSQPGVLPATGGETVQIADNSELGQLLVTPDGMTLYTNTVDSAEELRCTSTVCTGFWPPYTIDGDPTAGKGITGALGAVTRPDGSKQVTYNQQPLYTFYLDKQAGDAKGNGFTDFGGTWHVVAPGSSQGATSSDSNSGDGGYHY